MRFWRTGAVFGCAAALAACASRPAPVPAPAPPLAPTPIRTPPPTPPAPPPPVADWQDAPLAPGEWSYAQEGGASVARYGPAGQPSFVVRCAPGGQVSLTRTGAASNMIAVRTSSAARTLPARAAAGGTTASLPASDPLLDALVFSRGRYAIDVPGSAMLIVPSWPEPGRVIEDCRAQEELRSL
jgi:hypothetical protein